MQPAKKQVRSDEWLHRDQTREHIGQKLRDYYRAYATEELPPRLLALIKKLDEKADPSEWLWMARRALVVDDDPLVLETVVSMLEELGCETIPARSGTDALGQLARDQTVEILVADINMPGLSGVQLAERACAFRPELRVLLLSGREGDGRGFPLLQKPFSQPDLRRTMAETIGLCDWGAT
jgi:CheY-like chemotaxis protein